MATSYPDGLDNFTNPTASDTLDSATVPHATQHANTNDAIEAIEAELGTDPKGSKASVKARLDDVDVQLADLGDTSIATSLPLTSSGTVVGDNLTIGINASSDDTANYVVRRDANGEFVAGAVTIDSTKTPTSAVGKLYWDGGGTVNLGLLGGNVSAALGENLFSYVTNAEATTLAIGEVVYVYSSVGNRISVKRASNLTEGSSSKTLGIVAESIAANNPGFIIVRGIVEKQSLSGYTEGAALYLGATAGTFTATKPSAPNHLVSLGWVVRANNGNGQIYVNVQNGFELQELHNVAISSVANGQVLTYDSATELWKNADAAGGTTPATPTTEGVVYGKTELAGTDTETTALGNKALLSNTIGSANVAIGVNALTDNTEGSLNIAIGYDALANNTVGGGNTSIGAYTLSTNTTGENNTAVGIGALLSNTSGSFNFALGNDSLHNNTSGAYNTAIGINAAYANTTGQDNIGIGKSALAGNLTGNSNVAMGTSAGAAALGSGNVFVGYSAGSTYTGSNKLYIANNSTTSLIVGDFSAQTLIIDGAVTATSYAVPSGASSGFLKANGSVDSTTYAPIASPTLTGTPLSTTAAVDTNTTQIATTAYVVGQGYLKSATATTTYAPIASPTFTGTVTIPSGSSISGVPYLATANTFTGGVQQITTASAATVGLIVKGSASQTANLFEVQNSAGAAGIYINSARQLVSTTVTYLNSYIITGTNTDFGAQLNLLTRAVGSQGIIVRGQASQTASLQEWQNSAGSVLSLVDSGGQLRAPNIGIGGTSVGIAYVRLSNATGDTGATTAVFRGIASQTGDFLRFQNSTPTTLTAITAAGTINFASGNTSATATAGAITPPAQVTGYITMQVAGTTVKVPYYAA